MEHEINAVTGCLAGIALDTTVSIMPARIFRNPRSNVDAVAQRQGFLDQNRHVGLEPDMLATLDPPADRMARDLERLVTGSARLLDEHGYYPDLADGGGNLRLDTLSGSVTLVDVMPFYADGSHLMGDRPPGIIAHIGRTLAAYETFVGQYGA